MSFKDLVSANRRIIILQVLSEDGDYAHNDGVLRSALAGLGHDVSADAMRTELAWLAEQGLITSETVGPYTVARLTERGLDVAHGRALAPGVERPGPGR
ncbi:MAG: ArsR family transcriptional regulator [Alphaproteobacteria bacterium]|nr:ArsR family transcriptional regulator [Alphaproteobacteria bacterium]